MTLPDQQQAEIPPLYVSSPGYDDMGAVLDNLGLEYAGLNQVDLTRRQEGVVMLNCGGDWEEEVNLPTLREFIGQGGGMIASDHASTAVEKLSNATFGPEQDPVTITAEVVDDELLEILGHRTVDLTFDAPFWQIPWELPARARPLLEERERKEPFGLPVEESPWAEESKEALEPREGTRSRYLAYHFPLNDGHVVYTSFHNHAQVSEVEEALLQLLLMVPIAKSTDTTVVETYDTIVGDTEVAETSDPPERPSQSQQAPTDGRTVRLEGANGGLVRRRLAPGESARLGRSDFGNLATEPELGYISSEHIELSCDREETLRIADSDSTNGTALNGRDISDGEPRILSSGDTLTLAGALELDIEISLD